MRRAAPERLGMRPAPGGPPVTRPSQPQPGAVNGEAIPQYDSGSSWCMVGVRLVLVLRIYFSASDPKRRKGVNTQRGNSTLPVPLPVIWTCLPVPRGFHCDARYRTGRSLRPSRDTPQCSGTRNSSQQHTAHRTPHPTARTGSLTHVDAAQAAEVCPCDATSTPKQSTAPRLIFSSRPRRPRTNCSVLSLSNRGRHRVAAAKLQL
jgi:hypothetical protein